MFLFETLNQKLANYCNEEEREAIANAFIFGADAHEIQTRSSGEPYFTHPVAAAEILTDIQADKDTLIAALLHDTVEDTEVTSGEIKDKFGTEVAQLVDGVTKLLKIQFKSKQEAQAENFRKMMLAMSNDLRVIVIKLADRLHNMSTLGPLRPDKRRRIAHETLEIYAPLAHRLGMHDFKSQLEELAFEALYPLRYRILKYNVKQAIGNRKRLHEKLKSYLIEHLESLSIPNNYNLSGREKHLYSIYRKMQKRKLPLSEIMDVYGFRIVTESTTECYQLLGAVHSLFKPLPGRFKDYIALPKANGYQSLHTTLLGPYGVPIEVQIRTKEMDYMAEQGIAAHWLYKSRGLTDKKAKQWIQRLSEIQAHTDSSIEFVENVKVDLFPDEVYVFTPTGEIIELPREATPVDFAYAIHTEIGNHCIAARVNRRMTPLSYMLVHGETVEVITSPTASPNPAWLNFVKTGKAKSAIRQYVREQANDEAFNLGKRLVNRFLALNNLNIDESLNEQMTEQVLKEYAVNSLKTLMIKIGRGEKEPTEVAKFIFKCIHDKVPRYKSGASIFSPALLVHGNESTNITFAKCCYPIPGDKILGIMIPNQGLEIHHRKCNELKKQKFVKRNPQQIVRADWGDHLNKQFACQLQIESANYTGAIADIATVIGNMGIHIQQVNVEEADNIYGVLSMIIAVSNRTELAKALRALKRLPRIYRVIRRFKAKQKITLMK
ncbi:bifunctional (p)ppGpp synthetase/guanosine-3',5'-bis(diphosphate) 3'-pyrophosphohydrolase [Thiotrichales bacterium 19S11-10]|nr:bifunctional (p)ppGpp synthetase/guanosine-3',5'-bis(diphosphate) 3'-pyrophosphohydrolase [Thiotrichales bacterium 19S11-10]